MIFNGHKIWKNGALFNGQKIWKKNGALFNGHKIWKNGALFNGHEIRKTALFGERFSELTFSSWAEFG